MLGEEIQSVSSTPDAQPSTIRVEPPSMGSSVQVDVGQPAQQLVMIHILYPKVWGKKFEEEESTIRLSHQVAGLGQLSEVLGTFHFTPTCVPLKI